jgi:hypothetical protein
MAARTRRAVFRSESQTIGQFLVVREERGMCAVQDKMPRFAIARA